MMIELIIDTSLFVRQPYLRTKYKETNIEEDIDLKINTELKNYLILITLEKQVVKLMLIANITITV